MSSFGLCQDTANAGTWAALVRNMPICSLRLQWALVALGSPS